jgi:outer membrane protein TolC
MAASADPDLLVKELARLEAQIVAHARPVSLQEAISTGIRANPALMQTFSTIQQYEWQLIAAQRQWFPTLQLNNGTPFAGVQWTSFTQNYPQTSPTAPPAYSNTTNQSAFQPGATISWNAIDPTRQPNINAATQSLKQQKLLFDVSARNLILDIQQNYFAIQSSQQLIDSFRKIYAINQQQLAMLQAQRSIGMTTVLDVEATRSQLFVQLNQLVGYTRSYIEQTANLAAALALPEGTLATPSEPAALRGEWSLTLQQTIQQARREREEILASLAAAEAARWSAVAAIRSYLPAFQLVASGSVIANNGTQTYSYAGSSSQTSTSLLNSTASIGLGFTWSIFDGGIQAANAQAARAQARQQGAQAASSELQAMQQVRSSYGQLAMARVALSSAQQAYRSAELAQQASRARFAAGVGDITSVVQTIQQLSQAAEQVAEAILSYNSALAQLYRYSATWPAQSQSEVQQRLKQLRVGSTPAASAAQP